ncbi:GNAT family N-acetyltransferase [Tateyamaria sp. ANG-S1]|uniref:GNAT family N-acetyltransferase n=1 Tax=Tateyamaria sp. ANG-S1 TaxID=1577905 RepID=UPI00057CC72A|nr:GNAT family N-acetyltransferase [Tateyamaria sp. ANG-S1]KIC48221.1 GNAT family acetyltransferase [Tateyamaria sp. ANG-S1]
MRVETLIGPDIADALDDVARLRLAVFRDWPYLYEGDFTYERRYLEVYEQSNRAVIVAVYDGDWMVGAATAAPLSEHADAFSEAFDGTTINIETCFYCGESVLLPRFRGQGYGHAFFDAREGHAKAKGYTQMCFASIVRPPDHPLKPAAYRSLEPFWERRGYTRMPGVIAHFPWKDIDQAVETDKPLQFWIKDL